MTLEELIVLMSYKAQNIKAHISPDTFACVVEALERLKEIEEENQKYKIGFGANKEE
ncbi:MAG: hypothetical protein MJ170_02785 [Alphaproteobacteria bacterium]|nr:hypothetical protein [Alphaproteobacteria bacterium]